MRKVYTLVRGRSFNGARVYRTKEGMPMLCINKLKQYINIDDLPKEIDLVLTSTRVKCSYQLSIFYCTEIQIDSGGKTYFENPYVHFWILINNFIKEHGECYASIEV